MSDKIIDLRKIDYTKQTVTLGSNDDPNWTLAMGHIDAIEFDKRWKAEGWDGAFDDNPTEDEIKAFQNGLIHKKGIISKSGKSWIFDDKTQNNPKAIDITLMGW